MAAAARFGTQSTFGGKDGCSNAPISSNICLSVGTAQFVRIARSVGKVALLVSIDPFESVQNHSQFNHSVKWFALDAFHFQIGCFAF